MPAEASGEPSDGTESWEQLLARNLSRFRSERALTTSKLATSAGLARATVVNLQNGSGNPTVETLWSLASALNIPMADLLMPTEGPFSPVTVHRAASQPGLPVACGIFRLAIRLSQAGVEVWVGDLRRGLDHESDAHGSNTREHIVVVHGRIEAGPDDALVVLEEGDAIEFVADVPHRYRVLSGHARFVSFVEYRDE